MFVFCAYVRAYTNNRTFLLLGFSPTVKNTGFLAGEHWVLHPIHITYICAYICMRDQTGGGHGTRIKWKLDLLASHDRENPEGKKLCLFRSGYCIRSLDRWVWRSVFCRGPIFEFVFRIPTHQSKLTLLVIFKVIKTYVDTFWLVCMGGRVVMGRCMEV